MGRQRGFQDFDQFWVALAIFVRNAQHREPFALEFNLKALPQAFGVFSLHTKDEIRPSNMTGGHFDSGALLRSRRARIVVRVTAKECFRRWAAPLVARTNKKELGFHREANVCRFAGRKAEEKISWKTIGRNIKALRWTVGIAILPAPASSKLLPLEV